MRNAKNATSISRRNFLKALPVLFAAGCVGVPSIENIGNEISKQKAISKAAVHYKALRLGGLYNKSNPNLKGGVTTDYTYKRTISNNWTPGISYDFIGIEKMLSIAPGVVWRIRELPYRPGRRGGIQVEIGHGHGKPKDSLLPGVPVPTFISYYSHIDSLSEKLHDKVEKNKTDSDGSKFVVIPRGFPIGIGEKTKLMFSKGTAWEDPDNYGLLRDYGEEGMRNYMTYKDEIPDELNDPDRETIDKRWNNQMKCVFDMYNSLQIYDWGNWHKSHGKATERAAWSIIEEGRFLIEFAYPNFPHLFDISETEYSDVINKFRNNWPMIASLPWKL